MSKTSEKSQSNAAGAGSGSLAIATNGIHSSKDFANLMCGLMTDVIAGSVTPVIANAVCNAGGKLLKVVELEHKYGIPQSNGSKQLALAS